MGKNYRLLLLDIDGTITTNNRPISQAVRKALLDIKNHIDLSFVSARSAKSVLKFANSLHLDTPQIVEAGARIISPKGKTIWGCFLSDSTVQEIIRDLSALKISLSICKDGSSIVYSFTDVIPECHDDAVTRVSALALKKTQIRGVEQILKNIVGINFFRAINAVNSNLYNIDITEKEADKGSASRYLRELIGASKDEVIGIGDGFSDIPFMKEVGFKIAMGNAVRDLKSIADYIAPPVSQDGVIDAFRIIKSYVG